MDLKCWGHGINDLLWGGVTKFLEKIQTKICGFFGGPVVRRYGMVWSGLVKVNHYLTTDYH